MSRAGENIIFGSAMFKILRAYLEQFNPLSDAEFELLKNHFIHRHLEKGQFLQREGELAKYAAFVAKGCLRSYIIDKKGKARKDDVEIKLEDGEVVNKTGNFFDKTGRAIDNAWQDTKRAAKDVGDAIGDAAKKTGKEIDTALDKDK